MSSWSQQALATQRLLDLLLVFRIRYLYLLDVGTILVSPLQHSLHLSLSHPLIQEIMHIGRLHRCQQWPLRLVLELILRSLHLRLDGPLPLLDLLLDLLLVKPAPQTGHFVAIVGIHAGTEGIVWRWQEYLGEPEHPLRVSLDVYLAQLREAVYSLRVFVFALSCLRAASRLKQQLSLRLCPLFLLLLQLLHPSAIYCLHGCLCLRTLQHRARPVLLQDIELSLRLQHISQTFNGLIVEAQARKLVSNEPKQFLDHCHGELLVLLRLSLGGRRPYIFINDTFIIKILYFFWFAIHNFII